MKVTRDVVSQRIAQYVKTIMLPSLKGGKKDNWTKFKLGAACTMGWLGISDKQFEDMKEYGFVDSEGNIDVDLVRKAVMGGVAEAGGEVYVEKLGLWLSSDDLTKLLNFVETGVLGQN
jgi:hypothetical protein